MSGKGFVESEAESCKKMKERHFGFEQTNDVLFQTDRKLTARAPVQPVVVTPIDKWEQISEEAAMKLVEWHRRDEVKARIDSVCEREKKG